MKPVLVVWHDAHPQGEGWVKRRQIRRKPWKQRTVGILVKDGCPGHVTVAQTWDRKGKVYGELLHIPEGMVVEIRVLKR